MLKAERGLFDLRQGRPLFVAVNGGEDQPDRGVLVAPVEGLDEEMLERLRTLGCGPLRLVVTHHRARAMGLSLGPARAGAAPAAGASRNGTNGDSPHGTASHGEPEAGLAGQAHGNGDAPHGAVAWFRAGDGPPAVSLRLDASHDPAGILRLASAAVKGGSEGADVRAASRGELAGLTLARLGRLLPALVAVHADPGRSEALRTGLDDGTLLQVPAEQIEDLAGAPQLEVTHVSEAPVPLQETENTRFLLFRETHGFFEHVAVLIGPREEWPDPVPVRLHSACLTGDLFGSLRCDCGEQLRSSLHYMSERGGGVLLYLEQEGRGIGLGNKLRAYSLQEEGLDTVDADGALGFGADERRYDSAVEILRRLGLERIRLLTNNPEKVKAVEEGGIQVVVRQPLHGTLNRHNLPYVRAKVRRAGHWLEDMLANALPPD